VNTVYRSKPWSTERLRW